MPLTLTRQCKILISNDIGTNTECRKFDTDDYKGSLGKVIQYNLLYQEQTQQLEKEKNNSDYLAVQLKNQIKANEELHKLVLELDVMRKEERKFDNNHIQKINTAYDNLLLDIEARDKTINTMSRLIDSEKKPSVKKDKPTKWK